MAEAAATAAGLARNGALTVFSSFQRAFFSLAASSSSLPFAWNESAVVTFAHNVKQARPGQTGSKRVGLAVIIGPPRFDVQPRRHFYDCVIS